MAKNKINLGKLRALAVRQQSYLNLLNTIILLFLFFEKNTFHWYYLFIIPVGIFFAWIDAVYIWPDELDYWHKKSPVMKELLENGKKK